MDDDVQFTTEVADSDIHAGMHLHTCTNVCLIILPISLQKEPLKL